MAVSPTPSEGPKRVSVGKLVNHVLQSDTAKLTGQIAFKETDEIMERLEALMGRNQRNQAFVARAVFRVGLMAIENAIKGGLL